MVHVFYESRKDNGMYGLDEWETKIPNQPTDVTRGVSVPYEKGHYKEVVEK